MSALSHVEFPPGQAARAVLLTRALNVSTTDDDPLYSRRSPHRNETVTIIDDDDDLHLLTKEILPIRLLLLLLRRLLLQKLLIHHTLGKEVLLLTRQQAVLLCQELLEELRVGNAHVLLLGSRRELVHVVVETIRVVGLLFLLDRLLLLLLLLLQNRRQTLVGLGRLHGHGLAFLTLRLFLGGHLGPPRGHGDFVLLPQARFFVHVLLTHIVGSFLPRLGEHLGEIGVGGIGMLALERRPTFVGKGQKGRHGTLGRRGVLGRALVGWNLPGSLVEGLFDFVAGLVLAGFGFPNLLVFWRELPPGFGDELGNVGGLLGAALLGELVLDLLVLLGGEDDKGRLEALGRVGGLFELAGLLFLLGGGWGCCRVGGGENGLVD